VDKFLTRAQRFADGPQRPAAVASLRAVTDELGPEHQKLTDALLALADSLDS
jgi:hypothetical protein